MTVITASLQWIEGALNTPQFAQHQRNDWDQSFAHLFDSKLKVGSGESESEHQGESPLQARITDSEDAAARMRSDQAQSKSHFEPYKFGDAATSQIGRLSPTSNSDMSGRPEESESASPTLLREADEPEPSDEAIRISKDPAFEVSHSDAEATAPVIVVGLTADDALRISVRSNEFTTQDLNAFLCRLRSELSWKGFSLDRLSANGKIAFNRSPNAQQ